MRNILYNRQEGRMNEEVANRMKDEMRGEIENDLKDDVLGKIEDDMKDDVMGEIQHEMKDDVLGDLQGEMNGEMMGEMKGDVDGGIKDNRRDDVQDVDGQECGSTGQMGMEELVRKLEALCGDMAVVKGYIVALQVPMGDRCKTWVDGHTVQKVLHINGSTLKAMRENGTMPYSQLGKHLYYNVEDMDGLLRKHYVRGVKAGGAHE